MLVSLISRLVARSPRIVVDKQTDRHTERLLVTLAARGRRGLISTRLNTRGVRPGEIFFLGVVEQLYRMRDCVVLMIFTKKVVTVLLPLQPAFCCL